MELIAFCGDSKETIKSNDKNGQSMNRAPETLFRNVKQSSPTKEAQIL